MAKRRANGEGSIIKRTDGRRKPWEVRYQVNGKLRTWSYATDAEAKASLRKLQRDTDLGIAPPEGRQTVAAWLAEWLETVRQQRAPGTWAVYEADCRLYIIPIIGKTALVKVTPQLAQRVVANAHQQTGAHKAARVRVCLHVALQEAFHLGLIASNPVDRTHAPSHARRETLVLTAEQVAALRDATRGHRLEAFYALALSTAMRCGELLGLRWQDVEWTDGRVSVERNMQWIPTAALATASSVATTPGGASASSPLKTVRSRRHIPVGARTMDALREHRQRQVAERLAAGARWDDHDLVFCRRDGKPALAGVVRKAHNRILADAGLPPVRLHDLRHTAATLLLASGQMDAHEVADILGHAGTHLVFDLYGHVMPGRKRRAASIMDEIMHGPTESEREREGRQ